MFEAERVEFEIRRHAAFIGFDHRLAAAAIARDGIDRDRKIGRDQPRIDERTQQRDRAGRIAAGIGDAARGGDLLLLACGELGKAIGPAGGDAMGARCIEKARARLAHRRDERRRLLCRFVRQAEDGEIDLGEERALGLRIFPRLRAMLTSSMPAMPASRARMPSPVVPASPSMKILAAIAASLRFAASVRCRSRCQGANDPLPKGEGRSAGRKGLRSCEKEHPSHVCRCQRSQLLTRPLRGHPLRSAKRRQGTLGGGLPYSVLHRQPALVLTQITSTVFDHARGAAPNLTRASPALRKNKNSVPRRLPSIKQRS